MEDGKNATAAYYTIYDGGWSQPRLLNDDETLDCYPRIFSLGKDKKGNSRGAIITWSTVCSEYKDTDSVNKRQMALDLNGRFMDSDGKLVGDIIEITKTTKDTAAVSNNELGLKDYSDFASDVAACVSYNDDGLIVYYNKREYDLAAEDVGDVFFPQFSANAARLYTFGTGNDAWYEGKWQDTNPAVTFESMKEEYSKIETVPAEKLDDVAEERLGSYNECFYGQLFYDCLPEVTVNEELDEYGWWKDNKRPQVVDTYGEDEVNPALIIDCDAISYNDLGLFAYSIDRDGNMKTYNDRDIYLQIFDFKDKNFVYPICVTSAADSTEDSNVKFARAGGSTMLSWLSDGDIKMLDVSRLLKGYSKGENKSLLIKAGPANDEYYYINKSRPDWISITDGIPVAKEGADTSTGYIPPEIVVYGEKTEDTEEDPNQGQDQEVGASSISSFDAVSGGDYIYFMWSQSGLSQVGETETDEDGEFAVTDELTEDQLYVARCDVANYEISRPVQVTSATGAHYLDPAMVINDEGGLEGLAYKALTRKITADEFNESIEAGNKISDWSERQDKVDEATFEPFNIIDSQNACAVAFKVLPEGRVKVKNAEFTDVPAAGKETGFRFEVLNDSVSSRDNLQVYVYDSEGNDLLKEFNVEGEVTAPVIDAGEGEEITVEGLKTTEKVAEYIETGHMDGGGKFEVGGTIIPDVDDTGTTVYINVWDGDELLAYHEMTADFEEDCEISDLTVENTGERNEYKVSGKIYNGGTALSAKHTLDIGLARENGDLLMASIDVDGVRPFDEEEFETVIMLDDSDFNEAKDEKGNLKESFTAFAEIRGNKDSRMEQDGARIAYVDQMRNIDALTDVKLGVNNVVAVTVSNCAVLVPEYVSTLANAEAESDGGMGLKFVFEEQNGEVFDITGDGVVTPHCEGSGEIVLHVYPSDREFEGDNTSQSLSGVLGTNVDGYAEMPAGAIFTKTFTLVSSQAGETVIVTDKKGVCYAVVSENSVVVTGLTDAAKAKLKKVNIPAKIKVNKKKYNVIGIASDAFRGNTLIQSAVIGKNVLTVGTGAFCDCIALKKVKFGKNVGSIEKDAFKGDGALKSLTLPKNLTFIGISAFEGCSLLKKVTIPKNVREMGNRAFALCAAIKKVIVKSAVLDRVGIDAFTGIAENAEFKLSIKDEFKEKVAAKFNAAAGVTQTMVVNK